MDHSLQNKILSICYMLLYVRFLSILNVFENLNIDFNLEIIFTEIEI